MRAASPNRFSTPNPGPPTSEAYSLFRNILLISPCESIFCQVAPRLEPANFLRINILSPTRGKISLLPQSTNSLFRKILPVKSLESIFCETLGISHSANSSRFNILQTTGWRKILRLTALRLAAVLVLTHALTFAQTPAHRRVQVVPNTNAPTKVTGDGIKTDSGLQY